MFIKVLRRNVGTIIAAFGFILLTILTFGDIGDILSKEYWENVKNNLTSIGYMTVALTALQVVIKQGISEQALQKGMNTEKTSAKYEEHRALIASVQDKMIYIPYFLQIYNDRHTALRKRDFLLNNNFASERMLYASKKKKLIKLYNNIHTHMTVSGIKWATTEITYTKEGRIETLQEHRTKRAVRGIVTALIMMIAVVFITDGLFFRASGQPLWQKFVKLLSYVVSIIIGSIMPILREYEKGAFGIPNELDELNEIWREFKAWEVPSWVINEIAEIDEQREIKNDARKECTYSRGDIQTFKKEDKSFEDTITNNILDVSNTDPNIRGICDTKLSG